MADFLDVPLSSLLLLFVVFGFAPGFCLRLLVLIYPKGDPRRNELVAELYAMRWWERPFWVAQQLETAMWEGPRLRRAERRQRIRKPSAWSTNRSLLLFLRNYIVGSLCLGGFAWIVWFAVFRAAKDSVSLTVISVLAALSMMAITARALRAMTKSYLQWRNY